MPLICPPNLISTNDRPRKMNGHSNLLAFRKLLLLFRFPLARKGFLSGDCILLIEMKAYLFVCCQLI